MSYVTHSYYLNDYMGESVEDSDFPRILRTAEKIVEEMTVYRLSPMTFSEMPEPVKEAVMNAVCAQVEYLSEAGMDILGADIFQSATLGKFSYSAADISSSGGKQIYAPMAVRYLLPTGLCYRGG